MHGYTAAIARAEKGMNNIREGEEEKRGEEEQI